MVTFFKKYRTVLIFAAFLIFTSLNAKLALLCFLLFFQWFSILGILKQIKLYKSTRNGFFVMGETISIRKIATTEEKNNNYECTIEFHFPSEKDTFQIKHEVSSFSKPPLGKMYKIFINDKNPNESIVMDSFGGHWVYSLFIFLIIILALSVVDFILLKQIL